MPVCCRRNGSGRCINCSCTKSARPCVNCLPLRKGLCRNQDASNTLSPVPVPSLPAPSALDGIPPLPSNPDNLADTPPSTQLYVLSASSDPDDSIVDEAIFDEAIPDNAIFDEVSEATHVSLPDFAKANFTWGNTQGTEMIQLINEAYDVVVQWKRNIFLVPSGKVGKAFVSEITRLVLGYAEATALEGIALKAVVVMQVLLLQQPHASSKSRDHVQHLPRRLDLWKNGDVQALIREGSTIQKRIKLGRGRVDDDHIAHIFSKLMLEGKVKSALRYVTDSVKGGVLSLDNNVMVNGDNGQQEP